MDRYVLFPSFTYILKWRMVILTSAKNVAVQMLCKTDGERQTIIELMTETVQHNRIGLFCAKRHGEDKKKWNLKSTKPVLQRAMLSATGESLAEQNVISVEKRTIWRCITRIILSH